VADLWSLIIFFRFISQKVVFSDVLVIRWWRSRAQRNARQSSAHYDVTVGSRPTWRNGSEEGQASWTQSECRRLPCCDTGTSSVVSERRSL